VKFLVGNSPYDGKQFLANFHPDQGTYSD